MNNESGKFKVEVMGRTGPHPGNMLWPYNAFPHPGKYHKHSHHKALKWSRISPAGIKWKFRQVCCLESIVGRIVSSKKTRTSTREHHLIRLRRRGHRPSVGHAAREKQGGKKEAREKERFVWGLLNFQESMHLQWLHPSSQITVPRLD